MAEYHIHVVLGIEDRNALLAHDFAGEHHQRDALLRRHPRGGLIHEQQAGLVRKRNGKLDALQITIGEDRAGTFRLLHDPDPREQFFGCCAVKRRGAAPQPRQLPVMRKQRHLNVFAHGHRSECRGDLKCAADSHAPDLARLAADRFRTADSDRATVRGQLPVHHVEAGRLAGSVRADHGEQLALAHVERDILDGANATERFARGHSPRGRCPLSRLLRSEPPDDETDDAAREDKHDHEDREAEQRLPVLGVACDRVLQPGE